MIFFKILAVVALIVSIVWFMVEPRFEPGLAVVVSLSGVVSAFIIDKRKTRRAQQGAQQHQSVSQSSVGVQAGGNVNIGSIGSKKHDE